MYKLFLLLGFLSANCVAQELNLKKQIVVVAVIEKDGKILIAQRAKTSPFGGKWSFLGGKVEPGESLESGLKRELREELQIEAQIGGEFATSSFNYKDVLLELHFFKVSGFTGEIKLNSEHTCFNWVEPVKLLEYDIIEPNLPIIRKLNLV